MKIAVKQVLEGAKLRHTAALHDIPVTSLSDHVKRHGTDYLPRLGKKPTFTQQQETEIRDRFLKLSNSCLGLTTQRLRRMVYDYAEANKIKHPFNKDKKAAGKDWLYAFLKRYPEIIIRRPEACGRIEPDAGIAPAEPLPRPGTSRGFPEPGNDSDA